MSANPGPSNSAAPSPSAPVKRACDSCHRRKVKCIGEGLRPCKNCLSAGLNCTYNAIPQKKGPKGSRAKVLSELRENQRQSALAPNSYDRGFAARAISPARAKTPGLLTHEVLDSCVEYYFVNLYPVQPILYRQSVQHAILNMDQSVEAYCKLAALCAFVLIQPHMVLPPSVAVRNESGATSNLQLAYMLLEESIRVRRNYDFIESPTILSVYTSFFIFECYFSLDKQNAAWVYLRQAMTLAHIMGMHDEDTYKTGDIIECSRKRRLFWLLFITERAYAFKRHRPLTLYATIRLPTVDEDPSDSVSLASFIHLINLYKPFDETFFGLWNRTREGAVPSWLVQLQKVLADALPAYIEGTEVQAVNLRMSQQWLKTMVWQLAISHGFISSMSNDNTLSFRYPIDVSRDLVELSSEFSQHAMEIHGIGLIEKLFDVACTLIDVMAYAPHTLSQQNSYDLGPRDYLNHFIQLISTLRGGQSRYLPMLVNKVNEALPSHNLPASIARGFQATHGSGEYYESSGGSASNDATPYDSPPAQGQQGPAPLSLRPGPPHSSVMSNHSTSYSGHYESSPSHVQGPPLSYPLYQASMNYSDLTTSAAPPSHSVQDSASAMYPSHLASETQGHGTRASAYVD